MHDLLIRGAQVYDGLGNPPQQVDVAVDGGRISVVGKVKSAARQTVDACGLSLMPGIVDLHTHYDAQVTWDRTMSPSPALGVTTAVIGNCGFGVAPCPANMRETMMKNLSVVEGMDLNALLSGVRWTSRLSRNTWTSCGGPARTSIPRCSPATPCCALLSWARRAPSGRSRPTLN